MEKLLYYPTLNVAGFTSGYGGEGTKTIIPSRAQAKLDMRLVADQDPDNIFEKFHQHVEKHASGTVDIDVQKLGRCDRNGRRLTIPFASRYWQQWRQAGMPSPF
ncbi:peptidase dimerization domain-containing protein [Haladaptatus pallidirubidus]|uniref:peptidase dimerization domain-containing protein n=1 Tax=Haladaptatus pallidirubidus TaxID=1008152 RepID=UPI0035EF1774